MHVHRQLHPIQTVKIEINSNIKLNCTINLPIDPFKNTGHTFG